MNAAQGSALPARWRRGRILASIAALLITAVIVSVLLKDGAADQIDAWWLSARFTLREKLQPRRSDPDIVLALMDDRCTDHWNEPFVAWGPHLAKALDKLRLSGAKVIALDWIQPEMTGEWFKGRDETLQSALSLQPNIVFVKEQRPDWAKNKYIHTHESLLYAVPELRSKNPDPETLQGYAELPSAAGVVTSLHPALRGDSVNVSFAARIAEHWFGDPGRIRGRQWEIPGRTRVPLREDDTVLANFASGAGLDGEHKGPFPTFSLYDIARLPGVPDSRFQNKIVLIGNDISGNNDRHFIPFFSAPDPLSNPLKAALPGAGGNRSAAGVAIQANFVRTLLQGRAIGEPSPIVLWSLCMLLAVWSVVLFLNLRWVVAALALLLTAAIWIIVSFGIFNAWSFAIPILLPLTGLLISGGTLGAYLAFSEERERRQVMNLWGRYQDARLVNYLLRYPEARGGEGSEVPATVLFADLKNFTKTVELLSPSEALRVLNRYLSLLEVVTIEHGGLVDKYLGDGLMAQWGAPSATDGTFRSDHAEAAVAACLEIQKRAAQLRAREPNAIHFGLRLTLHTGPVVVGWVGASRLEFTIIGDTVNVTSRLQETAKQLDVEFLISESTYESVKGRVTTGKQAEVEIRGRVQPLLVYEVTGSM